MSAQYGRWNFDGAATPPDYLDRVRELLSPYGADGEGKHSGLGVDLLWFSFETTERNPKPQPWVLDSGEVLLWNGRLDNGGDLVREIGGALSRDASDVEIAAAAWMRWQQNCLGRLIGDWALSVWDPRARSLLLASDILGVRHLFYEMKSDGVEWCGILDPLILLTEQNLSFDEEYLAGWLAAFPGPHLTPYREIRRVPPASVVVLRPGSCTIRRYWDFDGRRRIRYARDEDYQVHFLELLRQSVRRRLRTSFPVLAELSGGMDSSSIICVADQLTSASGAPPIDTVSYYNDSEPHWNERPWFARVEAQRGRAGLHIDASAAPSRDIPASRCLCRPGACFRTSPVVEHMMRSGHRVLVSGVGGDEFLGGVPTPVPELGNLLSCGRLIVFCRRLFAWALVQRRPWLHLLRDTLMGFLPFGLSARYTLASFSSWLDPDLIRRQRSALASYPTRWRWLGPLPSFQENVAALDGIRRQLGCQDLTAGYPYERRYPYLDRDLLEFLFAIPREQLVNPGERRFLMRRALTGIVPEEILRRTRKAYVSRAPLAAVETQYDTLSAKRSRLAIAALGIVNSGPFLEALNAARQGKEAPVLSLLRAVAVEEWLEARSERGLPVAFAASGWRARHSGHDRRTEPAGSPQ